MYPFLELNANVLGVILGCFAALSIGTIFRLASLAQLLPQQRRVRLESLATWWALLLLVAAAAVASPLGVVLLIGILSLLGMREYSRLVDPSGNARVWYVAGLLAVIHFAVAYSQTYVAFWLLLPVAGLLVLLFANKLLRPPGDYPEIGFIIYAGLMLIVFCFSHLVLLVGRIGAANPVAGGIGWFLFVVLLTEINDIAQALWGRRFGWKQIFPVVSPNKTREGLIAGCATTLLLSLILSPWLTPYFARPPEMFSGFGIASPYITAVLAGSVIFGAGFLGDLTFSAIKRKAHAKDSGTLLPGQGGILDRIDSLIFSAPCYFYFNWILYEGGGN